MNDCARSDDMGQICCPDCQGRGESASRCEILTVALKQIAQPAWAFDEAAIIARKALIEISKTQMIS